MKFVLSLAALAAVLLAFNTARAVEDPPTLHTQLVEVEQQTPYLESATQTATSTTVSRIVKVSGAAFSSQSYAQFDNHNADLSRATFALDVEDGDYYGVTATFVKGPTFGIVQAAIDGKPIGEPFDAYAAAVAPAVVPLGTRALAEGKHMLTLTVTGKNAASTDYVAGLDLLVLDSSAAVQPTPTAVATAEVNAAVPATLALTLGSQPTFGAFQAGVTREYTASTTANVVSTAGDANLSVSDPGHLTNGAFSLPQPLRVEMSKTSWSAPVSNDPVQVTFKQTINANDALRTGSYSKTLTFTLSTTNP